MKLSTTLSAIALLFLTGCSLYQSSTQTVAVTLIPPDASVVINGLRYTGSPLYIELPRWREALLAGHHPEYHVTYYVIDSKMSTTGVIDACFSFLIIPYFGLCSGGAWELAENNVVLELVPLPKKPTEVVEEVVAEKLPEPAPAKSAPVKTEAKPAPAVEPAPAPVKFEPAKDVKPLLPAWVESTPESTGPLVQIVTGKDPEPAPAKTEEKPAAETPAVVEVKPAEPVAATEVKPAETPAATEVKPAEPVAAPAVKEPEIPAPTVVQVEAVPVN